jgi:hypothetical protein
MTEYEVAHRFTHVSIIRDTVNLESSLFNLEHNMSELSTAHLFNLNY